MSVTEILTLVIALWGAVLSTILGVHQLRRDRVQVEVKIGWAMTLSAIDSSEEYISIQATNVGHRPVTIASGGFLTSGDDSILVIDNLPGADVLPKKLEDGDSVTLYFGMNRMSQIEADLFQQDTRLTKAFVKDERGNYHTQKLDRQYLTR